MSRSVSAGAGLGGPVLLWSRRPAPHAQLTDAVRHTSSASAVQLGVPDRSPTHLQPRHRSSTSPEGLEESGQGQAGSVAWRQQAYEENVAFSKSAQRHATHEGVTISRPSHVHRRSSQPPLAAAHEAAASAGLPALPSDSPLDARGVTRLIGACTSPAQLHSVLLQHSGRLNFIHASAAIVLLSKMADATAGSRNGASWRSSGRLVGQMRGCAAAMSALVASQLDELQPRAVANCLWAAAKLAGALEETEEAGLEEREGEALEGQKAAGVPTRQHQQQQQRTPSPRPIGFRALALLLLGRVPLALPHFLPQHVSNTACAMASLASSTGRRTGDEVQWTGMLALMEAHTHPLLPEFGPQAIANLLHSLAVLEHRPDPGERKETRHQYTDSTRNYCVDMTNPIPRAPLTPPPLSRFHV